MAMMHNTVKSLVMELTELEVVYGYMKQNAPTEDARRMVDMNLLTVKNTLSRLEDLYYEMEGSMMPPYGEAAEVVPVFVNFIDAARYAFKEETQVIHLLKDMYLAASTCYRDPIFNCLVEHELNAMRLLYLIG
ncbi:MAG: hypothetical protein QHH10_03630 [Peptococcaceae bacterium]|jgi:hypothetical protein|nr:hypothetical protein [Peptococcaceae bacterium]MDH7524389.1 hypothetical protein [Peptococcaceae bacterium]